MTLIFTFQDSSSMLPDWRHCGCPNATLLRLPRALWMRLWPQRRLYQCANCRQIMLLAKNTVNQARALS